VHRRRVLIDALSLTQGGGSRSYLVNLLRELGHDSRGFAFTVLADSDDFAQMNSEWVEVVRVALPAQGHPGRVPLRVAYEQSVLPLRARNFDLLYCPADLAPVLCATPVVVALRNMHIYDQRFYQTLRLKLLERLVRLSARRAHRVVFPSRAAADRIRERVAIANDRVAIVHHGVSPESFAAAPRRAGGSANGPA
jgi:glycosyltransferase involved in cell wall biosynthesis